jgi:hypothetical protein
MKDKKGKKERKEEKKALREKVKDARKEAARREFSIKGILVYPYFIAILLSFLLIYLCVLKSDPSIKIFVLVAVLTPFYYFFLELISRKIVISKDHILIRKLLRKKNILIDDIVLAGTASFKSKTYIFFELVKGGPVIISNTYGRFGELLNVLSEVLVESKLTDNFKNLPESSYTRYSDVISTWVAILVFVSIIVLRLLDN